MYKVALSRSKKVSFKPLSSLMMGAALLYASPYVLAQSESETANAMTATTADASDSRLDTLTIEGNRLYEMAPSEQSGGYSVDSATVGTKTPAALRDIPQSISVITRDTLDDQNLDTLDEMAKRTPGLRVLSNDNGRSSIYSRGYEYDEYNIDGLPAPMASITGSVPNLAAFDRVEVMRGPSGLFNSTSEMGGIINLVRKRPTYDFQGHVTGRYGSWDQNYLETDISGPIDAAGRIRGRMVISNDDTNGYVDHNENTNQTFYGALDIDLDEATMLSLAYLRQHRDITVNNGKPTDTDGNLIDWRRSRFFGADWNDFNSQSNDWIAELTHRFDNGGYGRVAARYSNRNAGYNYIFGGSTGVNADNETRVAGTASNLDQESISVDASYSQPFEVLGNMSEFVVGADYKRYETDNEAVRSQNVYNTNDNNGYVNIDDFSGLSYVDLMDAGRSGQGGFRYSNERNTLEEYGLYSKVTFRPIQSLALIAGGRVSAYDVHTRDRDASGAVSSSGSRSDDSRFTPYAGAVFDIDDHHSLYASYSEVFKPQTETNRNGELLKPREGTQYEVGIKGSYFNGDLNARVSAFRMYDENYAASVVNENYSADVGKRRIQGGEFEITGSITDQWDVIAGYTYLDTEVERGDAEATFLLMPKNVVNLWTQYGFEGGMFDGFHIGGGVTALSDFKSSQGVNAPGYAVVDAMVGYDFTDNLKGQLNFNNILDKSYYDRVGSFGTFNMYGAPSNVVASLRYDF